MKDFPTTLYCCFIRVGEGLGVGVGVVGGGFVAWYNPWPMPPTTRRRKIRPVAMIMFLPV